MKIDDKFLDAKLALAAKIVNCLLDHSKQKREDYDA